VQSITSVKYYDTAEVQQTLAADQYVLDNVSDPAWVVRPTDVTYPDVAEGVNNVVIRFVAGYSTLPAEIKHAILMLVAFWFDNRSTVNVGNIVNNLPWGVEALLTNHRSYSF
jgi:uncharacterized phiE125 gp8 family phage protein